MRAFNPPHRGAVYVLAGAAITAFIAVNAVNALQKGGDANDYLSGGSRALHGTALYEGSGPAAGFIGPPFQALFFAPFAAVAERSQAAGKLLWYAVNLGFLAVGILSWYFACSIAMSRWALPGGRRALNVVAAIAAILLPLQTNFEHQNMNALLLGVLGLGTWLLVTERPRAAGIFLGFAAALKVFPALVIAYLAARRQWKALVSASVTAVVLTLLPVFVYGPSGFVEQAREWAQVSSGGWPVRFNNQSLIAALDRFSGAWSVQGGRTAADAPVAAILFVVSAVALLVPAGRLLRQRGWHAGAVPSEIAAVIILSLLLSPIAWDHYWTLLFPAFLLMRYAANPDLLGKAATRTFWFGLVLVTGISRVTAGSFGWNLARRLSVSTVAAVVLYVMLLRLSALAAEGSPNRDR